MLFGGIIWFVACTRIEVFKFVTATEKNDDHRCKVSDIVISLLSTNFVLGVCKPGIIHAVEL
jgi:hypothetical protein